MREKTIQDLAAQLGVCARTFHRRLDRKDPEALKLHSAETTWRCRESLETIRRHLAWLAERFESDDPAIAKAGAALSAKIEARLAHARADGGRPETDWQADDEDPLAGLDLSELLRASATPTP